mmetsp:Transcript_74361/g.207770  ORF Transcript_74361/g.207770 Transcript_74361/m.207770 type:complete len:441 (-) Transcript_74361:35-1357(-)
MRELTFSRAERPVCSSSAAPQHLMIAGRQRKPVDVQWGIEGARQEGEEGEEHEAEQAGARTNSNGGSAWQPLCNAIRDRPVAAILGGLVTVEHVLELLVLQHLDTLFGDRHVLRAHSLDQFDRLFAHLLGRVGVRQAEDGLGSPEHHEHSVHAYGVRLCEQPLVQRLDLRVQRVSGGAIGRVHDLTHDARNDIRRHRDYPHSPVVSSRHVALVIVTGPAGHALVGKLFDPLVAHALFHAAEVVVARDLHDDLWLDVLTGSARDVVDNGRAILQAILQMHHDTSRGGLPVVRVDQEGAVHTCGETLFGRPSRLACVVASSVAYNAQLVPKFGLGVGDQNEMLLPRHKMPLAGGAADDQALNSVGNLVLDNLVVRFQIHVTVGFIRRLHRCHEAEGADLLHRRGAGRHLRPLGRGAIGHLSRPRKSLRLWSREHQTRARGCP